MFPPSYSVSRHGKGHLQDSTKIAGRYRAGENNKRQSTFRDNGIEQMLETKDYVHVDIFSPFLRAIIDRCCGESSKALVATAFTEYVMLLQWLFKGSQRPTLSSSER